MNLLVFERKELYLVSRTEKDFGRFVSNHLGTCLGKLVENHR